jgi:hypothetical protein
MEKAVLDTAGLRLRQLTQTSSNQSDTDIYASSAGCREVTKDEPGKRFEKRLPTTEKELDQTRFDNLGWLIRLRIN